MVHCLATRDRSVSAQKSLRAGSGETSIEGEETSGRYHAFLHRKSLVALDQTGKPPRSRPRQLQDRVHLPRDTPICFPFPLNSQTADTGDEIDRLSNCPSGLSLSYPVFCSVSCLQLSSSHSHSCHPRSYPSGCPSPMLMEARACSLASEGRFDWGPPLSGPTAYHSGAA